MTRSRWLLVLVSAGLAVVASLCVGSRLLSPVSVWHALLTHDTDSLAGAVVWERVPRTLIGLAVGGSLAIAGAAMQGVARNPLADPGLLGLNAGASFGVVAGLTWFAAATASQYIGFAIAGAATAAIIVYGAASLGRDGATPAKLVLAGAAVTALFMSVLNALLISNAKTFDDFRMWQVGSIGGRSWDSIETLTPLLFVGAVIIVLSARSLDAMAVGDDLARGLGARLRWDRLRIFTGVVLLCGAATALAGPISFVGLMVPHALRLLGVHTYRGLLSLGVVGGGVLLLVADTIGRVIAPPAEMQVGVMTALIGVPVFIVILRRKRKVVSL